jgi:hypothetical protein
MRDDDCGHVSPELTSDQRIFVAIVITGGEIATAPRRMSNRVGMSQAAR